MKRDRIKPIYIFFILFFFFSLSNIDSGSPQDIQTKERIISTFIRRTPRQWGEVVTGVNPVRNSSGASNPAAEQRSVISNGVKTRLNTDQKVLALTFDACGGPKGSGYDGKLIEYLESEKIPATLFISGRWMDANPEIFKTLSKNPLFEIENHGLNHKPCSAIGRSVYGIKGTGSVGEIYNEIEGNALKILNLTGRKPKYYRPGTVYCDEICVEIANALGVEVVNFSVRGDAGATYSKKQVKEALWNAPPSSIILMHMNHPAGETAEGVMAAIPELKKRGFKFAELSEYGLK